MIFQSWETSSWPVQVEGCWTRYPNARGRKASSGWCGVEGQEAHHARCWQHHRASWWRWLLFKERDAVAHPLPHQRRAQLIPASLKTEEHRPVLVPGSLSLLEDVNKGTTASPPSHPRMGWQWDKPRSKAADCRGVYWGQTGPLKRVLGRQRGRERVGIWALPHRWPQNSLARSHQVSPLAAANRRPLSACQAGFYF